MSEILLHIRVSKKTKEQMQSLIDDGVYSNAAELTREGIRHVLLKYKEDIKQEEK
jgi:Arc/MetJ-type ribon-helix-helix transcriptional regulator